jgi:N-acetylmuramic acid 6-phosphate etherase
MKSGTAQKLVLNMITTASMVRLGKVYRNMMVDRLATSEKLTERSKRVLMTATGLRYEEAERRLREADGSVKRAIVTTLSGASREAVDAALHAAEGHVRRALVLLETSNEGHHA